MIPDMPCLILKIMVFHKQENVFGYLGIWGSYQKNSTWYHLKNLYKVIWLIFLTQIHHLTYIKHRDKLLEYTKYIIMTFLMLMNLFAMIYTIGKFVMTESA